MNASRIAVLAFEGISPFHLSVPCLVFGEDRRDAGLPQYEVLVCAERPGMLPTSAGFGIACNHGLEALQDAGTVIVPSWNLATPPSPALIDALRAAHARGATLAGLCLGAFVLAGTGLLDGRRATTHWSAAAEFAARFPRVRLDADVLYVDDGQLLTSAGTAAALDCCLHLLRKRLGAELANRAARRMVVAPHRLGDQAQFIQRPAAEGTGRLGEALAWAREHIAEDIDIDALAARAAMSRRTFTRQFRAATGMPFTRWLIAQRLVRAQALLETTDLPVERVASVSGFGSALALRQHFGDAFRLTPTAYRREFRGDGASLRSI